MYCCGEDVVGGLVVIYMVVWVYGFFFIVFVFEDFVGVVG